MNQVRMKWWGSKPAILKGRVWVDPETLSTKMGYSHCHTRLINCVKLFFFFDTSEAWGHKFLGLCGVICDNKNSKEQEVTGSLWKRTHHGSELLAAAQASCALDWVSVPGSTLLSFSCVLRQPANSNGDYSQSLEPSHQCKKGQTIGLQTAGRRGWWGGQETQHLLVPVR